jgi:hypothetical protein
MAQSKRMKSASRKRGADTNTKAVKHRKIAKNFAQSKDIREDRARRQEKFDFFPLPKM